MLLKHIFFENRISFSSVIDVTAANDQCLNGNHRQNGQKVFEGNRFMAIGQRIVSIVRIPLPLQIVRICYEN